ncbi:hypothetical protein ACFVVM_32775 [Nocardia sp. NPDC058176]|uniref:hypothetical protein n=1 Tax=Nocardia sp. NPDC058176 TaxID=3346368 RepID=UPI0036D8D328
MIIIGAQAVYLHTGSARVAIAESTKDSDVAIDLRRLGEDPTIDAAMRRANFIPDPEKLQPGAWVTVEDGIPVDIMVPAALAAGPKGKRSVNKPPHHKMSMRRAHGLEAAVVDFGEMIVRSLDPADGRAIAARVAGPAALIVAKCHKIGERVGDPNPDRLNDKDAHDLYRILLTFDTDVLAATFAVLLADEISSEVTDEAVTYLDDLFGAGPEAIGSAMAGSAEEGVGEPEEVALATSILAADLVQAIRAMS